MATIEEAIHCPRCQETGKEVKKYPPTPSANGPMYSTRGRTIYVFHCQNEKCHWYGTGWTVQVNRDGSVPERTKGMKEFPALSVYDEAAAKRILDELKEN